MPKKNSTQFWIDDAIVASLEKRKNEEGRVEGMVTFIENILNAYLRGTLIEAGVVEGRVLGILDAVEGRLRGWIQEKHPELKSQIDGALYQGREILSVWFEETPRKINQLRIEGGLVRSSEKDPRCVDQVAGGLKKPPVVNPEALPDQNKTPKRRHHG